MGGEGKGTKKRGGAPNNITEDESQPEDQEVKSWRFQGEKELAGKEEGKERHKVGT